jgi:hypothetical protein
MRDGMEFAFTSMQTNKYGNQQDRSVYHAEKLG